MFPQRPRAMVTVSVILPTYNEKENIKKLITSIMKITSPFEVIVVDDDSPDRTWEVVEGLKDEYQNLKLIRRTDEKGLVTAIREGIMASKGDAVVWMDCDFSMPPEVIPSLVKTLGESDVAVGSRYAKGGRDARGYFRVLTSWFLNRFASLVLGHGIKDYTSGFVAARKHVFDEIKISGDYGEYCIDFLYNAAKKFKVVELPYTVTDRTVGESKTFPSILSPLKHAWVYGTTVLKVRFGFYD
jgi:dolichol-phosphate mannosyltransferase